MYTFENCFSLRFKLASFKILILVLESLFLTPRTCKSFMFCFVLFFFVLFVCLFFYIRILWHEQIYLYLCSIIPSNIKTSFFVIVVVVVILDLWSFFLLFVWVFWSLGFFLGGGYSLSVQFELHLYRALIKTDCLLFHWFAVRHDLLTNCTARFHFKFFIFVLFWFYASVLVPCSE